MKKNRAGLGFVLFTLLVYSPLLILLRGWTAKKLWDWFAVPMGAPHLPTVVLIGCSLMVGALTATKAEAPEGKGDSGPWEIIAEGAMYWLGFCAILLGEGALLRLFL